MYTLHDYARMIADDGRIGPYVRALEAVVRPGCVVADVGAGTGIFALVACRLGARRVFAMDTNDAIEVGRELARENGFADRISFFRKDAREVELPERADVVVSDLRGASPLCGDHLAILEDARNRFLKPGGVLVPARDRLMVAVVDKPDLYAWATGPSSGPLGVSLQAMHGRLAQAACSDSNSAPTLGSDLLSAGVMWATLDYATVRPGPVAGHVDLSVDRAGIGHGLVLWFEAVLPGGQGFTTAPGQELCYGRLFLPWPHPAALAQGDRVAVDLWGQAGGEPWGWNSSVTGPGGARETFKQSSFLGWAAKPVPVAASPRGLGVPPVSHGHES